MTPFLYPSRVRYLLPALLVLHICATATPVRTLTVGPSHPLTSIGAAMAQSRAGDTILVEPGVYREEVLMNRGVALVARAPQRAEIRGSGRGVCVSMSSGNLLRGFVIARGSIGIVSKGDRNRIEQCHIRHNAQSGVLCVGHLPTLLDNVIAFNRGSGIQGQDLRSTTGSVIHTTIAYNAGHGIALSGMSDITIEHAIIAFNEKADIATTDESSHFTLRSSCLYRNGQNLERIPVGNISVDPLFVNHRRENFSLQEGSGCRGAAETGEDMGARTLSSGGS